jgi:hypothetical protein
MPFVDCKVAQPAMKWRDRPPEANEDKEVFPSGATRSKVRERYDLVPAAGLRVVAEVMAKGAQTHGEWNWQRGMPTGVCINHAIRHLYQYLEGDRSERHLAHAACNLLMALHFEEEDGNG